MKKFSVGFHDFNKDEGLNFQLNRFYSSGLLSYDELMEIGKKVDSFECWIKLFLELAEEAARNGDDEKEAVCLRAAHFYTLGDTKDCDGKLKKAVLYEKCFDAYSRVFDKEKNLKYERIPFETGYLPVYVSRHTDGNKGVIVLHGGYDSFMQEFLGCGLYFFDLGYDVYFFEGPGQGEVLYRCNMKMTSEWEHCVSAVLDFYHLNDVTLIGISLGGYLATRAAAYEPRIKRLVMFDLIYDFYGSLLARLPKIKRTILDYLTKHPGNILWKTITKKMNKVYFLKWLFEQGYFIYDNVHTPCEYFNCIKQYNTREISGLITQDTLVLAGEKDIYTVFLNEQVNALVHAKSVTSRLFTAKESADHHCQIGNYPLVLSFIAEWIEKVR
ncbi:MAG: alpha/beta hydrolase [Oscillospiraceae bacterium]|nr:alpha/beta hydrolase [Oscillospiraceae bacterium]